MKIVTRHDESHLGSWTNSEWRPPRLAGLVDKIWHSEGALAHRGERILPNGTVELVLNLGEPFRLLEGTGTRVFAAASLCGMQSGPLVIEQPARHDVLNVRLHPAGAYALLGMPTGEVSGRFVELHDLVGHAATELLERCRDAASVEARFRLVAEWVSERVARSRGIDPPIAWAAAQIERSGGARSIGALREQTGLSPSRFAATLREQIGVTPKRYARIIRFRRVVAMLHARTDTLADIALAAGYYDQPHMTAEFRELSGLTPREFLAVCYPDSISAAETSS